MKIKFVLVLTIVVFAYGTTALAVPTAISGPIVNPANNHTYYLLEPSTCTDAEISAIQLGGHLVTINEQSENDWVFNTFASNYGALWIGLNDAAQEGVFAWLSGEPVNYTNWETGQPDISGGIDYELEDYVVLWNDTGREIGRWNDIINASIYPTAGVVEIVPEPATLFLLGLGGLMLRKRRN